MNKKQSVFISILTILVVGILVFLVGTTIRQVDQKTEYYCFENLTNASKQMARELYNTTDADRTILTAMAAIIANPGEEKLSDSETSDIMRNYNSEASFVSYVELFATQCR